MVVPALVHDGRLYLESMDIVAYLDELVPANPLIPSDPERRRLAEDLVADGKRLHVSLRFVSFRWGLGRLGRVGAKEEEALRRLEPAESPERMFDFYSRYDKGSIDESTYLGHLAALEQGFARLEARLTGDGRTFLTGDSLTMADMLWALKALRLTECGYPFARRFPHVETWFARVCARPSFQSGVMQRYRLLSGAFRWKAAVENFFGAGLGAVSGGGAEAAR
jgi:glutathione S-transferase